ncbi:hypothetical protein ACFPK9_04885 [Rubritalea spongiae]|uniref:Uncharacterized protein n=1 Tax=Rubritalea spongiae TaxID=430797 RepID=A0ABW5E5H8_9BACT
MFQTKLDRWLRENLVYEHHIKVVSLPEKLPRGVKVSEITSPNYQYLLIAKKKQVAERLIAQLTHAGSVFSTKIAEGSHWYNPLINNKKKSFTFRIFWWAVALVIAYILYIQISIFLESEFFFKAKQDLIELLGK